MSQSEGTEMMRYRPPAFETTYPRGEFVDMPTLPRPIDIPSRSRHSACAANAASDAIRAQHAGADLFVVVEGGHETIVERLPLRSAIQVVAGGQRPLELG